jgi:hypothetical protein
MLVEFSSVTADACYPCTVNSRIFPLLVPCGGAYLVIQKCSMCDCYRIKPIQVCKTLRCWWSVPVTRLIHASPCTAYSRVLTLLMPCGGAYLVIQKCSMCECCRNKSNRIGRKYRCWWEWSRWSAGSLCIAYSRIFTLLMPCGGAYLVIL